MADAAISFVVNKVGDLLIKKVALLQGIEGKVQWLKDELERMQCFLKDAAEKQGSDERVRKWISDIRSVAQDAEDAVETFVLKVENASSSGWLLDRSIYLPIYWYHLGRMENRINSVRARLEDIDRSRGRYGIRNLGEGKVLAGRVLEDVQRLRRLSRRQKDKQVVGVEEDVELLLENVVLEGDRAGLSVATVVGMGGIGKSTLARLVYNHAAVADCFDCRAWVCVSSEFNPKEVMKKLMLQLLDPEEDWSKEVEAMEKLEEPVLQEMIYDRLCGRRYFVVLDDVWEDSHWEFLSGAFPDDEVNASTLLLTSRKQDIVSSAQFVHKMKTLDPDKSWELFLKKGSIDNTYGKYPEDLTSIKREILKKCDGLPLAIAVAGGLVKQRGIKNDWERVLKELNSHLRRGGNKVSAILELSYNNLPPYLKPCFLCLGFFKEDATIRAEKLVQVWIAQGLIPNGGEETMEEIGMSYLDELINRNMVQVKGVSKDGRVKRCHIHDLLRELSITKAKEEISLEILREKGDFSVLNNPRHRVVYCSGGSSIDSSQFTNQNELLRSLFVHGTGNSGGRPSYWKSFELLWVLDFEDFGLDHLPDAIGRLISLRYLGLRNTRIWRLPSSLGELRNLEVLDIANYFIFMVELPDILWKLESLRHLYISSIISKVPLRIHSLKNLQTLSCISKDDSTPEDRTYMNNLRELNVKLDYHSSRYVLRNMPSLEGLGGLRRLTKLKLQGNFTRLPSEVDFPPNLSYLSLIDSSLCEDPMPVLEKLPKLMYLTLDHVYTGCEMVVSCDGFPKLKVITLRWMPNLVNVRVEEGGMKDLKRWETYECPARRGTSELELGARQIPENLRPQEGVRPAMNDRNLIFSEWLKILLIFICQFIGLYCILWPFLFLGYLT